MIPLIKKYQDILDDDIDLQLQELTENVLIVPRDHLQSRQVDDIYKTLLQEDNFNHNELIDFLIHQLVKTKQDNRLTKGYDLGADLNVNDKICGKTNSFHITYLKSTPWKMLHNKIGSSEFIKLLLYNDAFLKIELQGVWNRVQLFGQDYQSHNYQTQNYQKYISKNRMLYREEYQLRRLNPIPDSKPGLLRQMFYSDFEDKEIKSTSIPKKFRKIYLILGQVIANHKSCPYPYIVENYCPAMKDYKGKDLRSVGTDPKAVVKFVLCVIDKVLPLQCFGTKYNKHVVMQKISRYILASRLERIARSALLDDIKITDIAWLATNTCIKLNKQDLVKRRKLFQEFLIWIHSHFVCKLVACFFHVTDSLENFLFYRHHLWKRLTKPFMDMYFAKYLSSSSAETPVNSFIDSERIQGRLRLMAKPKTFRVINVPFKGTADEKYLYWNYLKNEVKPVRKILLQARMNKNQNDSYCFSLGDISTKIAKYKDRIQAKSGLQEFYYIKFDAQSCYDTIPKEKVKNCSKKLIQEGETFVYRQISAGRDLDRIKNSSLLLPIGEFEKLDIIKNGSQYHKNQYLFDQAKTVILQYNDVMKVIDSQLDDVVVQVKDKNYSRKNGIFQGHPLSGIFCDIVYDELIETYMDYILEDDKSLLLRIADDFMVISTDLKQIQKTHSLTQQGFGDFEVKINNDKTKLKLKPTAGADEVVFCGLTLDMKNLHVVKTHDTYGEIAFYGKTYKQLYQKLLWLFKTRIHNQLIKANNINYLELNLINTMHILKNMMQLFTTNRKRKTMSKAKFINDEFISFSKEILLNTWEVLKLKPKDDSTRELNDMWYHIVSTECLEIIVQLIMV